MFVVRIVFLDPLIDFTDLCQIREIHSQICKGVCSLYHFFKGEEKSSRCSRGKVLARGHQTAAETHTLANILCAKEYRVSFHALQKEVGYRTEKKNTAVDTNRSLLITFHH